MSDLADQPAPCRVAAVTGGARGIGRAIAEELAVAGHDVAVLDVDLADLDLRQGDPSDSIAHGGRRAPSQPGNAEQIHGYECDVSSIAAVEAAMAAVRRDLGRVDVLVNNAGVLRQGWLQDLSDDDWATTLAVNLTGAFYCTRAVIPFMLERRFGRIISIASITAVRGEPRTAGYAASKGGLIGFTKSLARETAGKGVTVNAIAPGFVMTDQTRATFSGSKGDYMARQIPMGRFGVPADIAGVACFLASDAAAYMTGQVLVADGGVC